jgi:predicted CoA-binding protein
MTKLADIEHFLAKKRLAVVGVSHNSKDFTRSLFRELLKRGYDVAPVNPAASEIDGVACVARLSDVRPPVEAVLLLTNPRVTGAVVAECAQAGVETVWMYRAIGAGAVNPEAVRFCKSKGIRVIAGECPFMFLPDTGFPHSLHRSFRKLVGSYPR